jgi:hypothetical protein
VTVYCIVFCMSCVSNQKKVIGIGGVWVGKIDMQNLTRPGLDDNLLHIVNHTPFLDRGETKGASGHG